MSSDYVDVNGLRTYYEVHGEGEPLLLMHGGFCTVEVLSALSSELSRVYRVIAPERRGHGRTADVEGPFDYDRMAQDTTGIMDALGIESAHLVGFSDGANTALVVAVQRPELVKKLVSIGGNFHYNGIAPQLHQFMAAATPDNFMQELAIPYKDLSPDGPEHFPVVFAKIMRMWKTEPKLTVEQLATIAVPSLIISADRDMITLEHTLEMFRAIPNSQLYVVPRANHMSVIGKHVAPVSRAVLEFLAQ
jgi:pimeloyl-ACP methyl ester carboxylesterase